MSSSGNDLFAGLSLAPSNSQNSNSNSNSNSNRNNSSDSAFHSSAPSLGYTPPAPPTLLKESKSQTVVPSTTMTTTMTTMTSASKPVSVPPSSLPMAAATPSSSAAAPVRAAPVTDKLLTLLGDSSEPPSSPAPTRPAAVAVAPAASVSPSPRPVPSMSPAPAHLPSAPRFVPAAKQATTKKRASRAAIGTQAQAQPTEPPTATGGTETISSSSSDADSTPTASATASATPTTPREAETAEATEDKSGSSDAGASASASPGTSKQPAAAIPASNPSEPKAVSAGAIAKASVPVAAAAAAAAATDASTPAAAHGKSAEASIEPSGKPTRAPSTPRPSPRRPSKPPPLEEETQAIDAKQKTSLRGVGVVKEDTPIPNCDVALRVLRKFAQKTKPHVPESHGGTQPLSLWARYVAGTPTTYDTRFDAYKQFVESVAADGSSSSSSGDNEADAVVENVLGASGDTMQKAKLALASFCHLMSVWGHASTFLAKQTEQKGSEFREFCGMVSIGLDTATSLVTHGCLDGVLIGIGANRDEYHKAADVLAESVFSVDLSQSSSELSAMKFLLSTGCRVDQQRREALLRGSHLLQTIRVLYHVFLSTPVEANKTTARASLQQLVTSVFIRMIAASASDDTDNDTDIDSDDEEEEEEEKKEKPPVRRRSSSEAEAGPLFPTQNHRDAFLVLRSLCKLSMRVQPSGDKHSHTGLQTSGSNTMWDSSKDPTGRSPVKAPRSSSGYEFRSESGKKGADANSLHHVYTHAIHPALESKILALDLLLYVLTRTNMTGSFLQNCGPQFHFAIRNYLCVSLLKNCTSENTTVVKLSLLVFVPIFQNFRSILKAEIEAFVTNVFFVILDSKNSPMEHKSLVVTLFNEICSDPTTLAEIFLNYDCDLSAVDLFHRIINTLSRVARTTDLEATESSSTMSSLLSGQGGARMERIRTQHRELRLNAMRALRQVLASLNASIVEPMPLRRSSSADETDFGAKRAVPTENGSVISIISSNGGGSGSGTPKKSLVEIYDDKKKRREEDSEIVLRFNQKPKAGIAYATKCGHIDSSDPADVARFLHKNKDRFEKTQIGEYLGREPEYDNGMPLKVLHEYVHQMDFDGLVFDNAIRYYLSGFRLPGEAQKIDRILEKFAERYSEQNPDAFPSADVAFILSFSIIMLNTDLHNPSIKEERKMTKDGFIRNNRGICDGQDLPREMLIQIFDRIRENPISLKEDDDARERVADSSRTGNALSPAVFFTNHYDEMDRTKESNFTKERDQIVRTTESLLRRRRHGTESGKAGHRRGRSGAHPRAPHLRYVRTDDSGLRDEYVAPMFEVTWGPALAAFSTAMESANGTVGALLAIATDEELEAAAINAAETIEVCLTGFRFAICTAGLVGNDVARESFMIALSRFSQLGTGVLLEPRHVRCIQTMLVLARSDGELLGASWEHIFKALSEINRFHQLFQLMARNDRVVARAAERRKSRLVAREKKREEKERRRAQKEESESIDNSSTVITDESSDSGSTYDSASLFDESDDLSFNEDMDVKEIDEANARTVYEAVPEDIIEAIYERSSSLSTSAVKEFILQLCRVSRMEISDYGGSVASDSNEVSLTSVHYRKRHDLLTNSVPKEKEGFHHQQTNIYNLQKLVEVTHYNMDSRPRLVFNDLWTTVSASLTSTALHSNSAVAMYAVDSFRQLCIQYLQREELGVFEFQRRFLKPLETVMVRSEISMTKELLLRCVERIILMFGSPREGSGGGKLRSGWRPVLKVLGLAGRDSDEEIAKIGFEMLNEQISLCLDQCKADGEHMEGQGILLVERFVDLVDALLIYVGGPHEEMSLQSIDDLLKLCDFLADESTVSPLLKKRRGASSGNGEGASEKNETTSNEELELWWPILLGLSRSVGDSRKKIRHKSLESMTKIVSSYFFPSEEEQESLDDESKSKYIQTLQLVYRGIFSPVLEFGDESAPNTKAPSLPSDMDRFLSGKSATESQQSGEWNHGPSWIDTMYDRFMDDCIHICIRSMKVFDDDTLIEDVFAVFNSCLISESGALAVKGLRRLEIFVTSDLPTSAVSDDTWATVSHMLRRSLPVRGLPKRLSSTSLNGSSGAASDGKPNDKSGSDPEAPNPELEQQEMIREFVGEDSIFIERRFIGSNAISVIGKFMETERFKKSLSLRWRLFLISGLGRAIRDWEAAAGILAKTPSKTHDAQRVNPPSYLETAYYGRKWMNRFLLQVAAMKEIEGTAAEGSRQEAAQDVIKEQTQALVSAFLEKEAVVNGEGKKLSWDVKSFDKLMNLVQDMLAGYAKLTDEHLKQMSWLNPVLSSCIHTSNEDIRLAIQKLVERLH